MHIISSNPQFNFSNQNLQLWKKLGYYYFDPNFSPSTRKYISSGWIWNIHILSLSIFLEFFFGRWYYFFVGVFKSFFFLIIISFNWRSFISTSTSSTISRTISWAWSPSTISRSWTSSVSWSGSTSFTIPVTIAIPWSRSGGSFSSTTTLLWTLRSLRFYFRFNLRNLCSDFFCNDFINFFFFFLNSRCSCSFIDLCFAGFFWIAITITMAIPWSRSGSSFPVFGSWTSSSVSGSGSGTSSIWKSKQKKLNKTPKFW